MVRWFGVVGGDIQGARRAVFPKITKLQYSEVSKLQYSEFSLSHRDAPGLGYEHMVRRSHELNKGLPSNRDLALTKGTRAR